MTIAASTLEIVKVVISGCIPIAIFAGASSWNGRPETVAEQARC